MDYKGLHVAILSAEQGISVENDPYELHGRLIPGAPAVLQRAIIKKLVLTALNARSRKSAFASFREGFSAGHVAKGMTNAELEVVLDAFTARHPCMSDHLCADQGIRLMNLDGQIAAIVQQYMTRRAIPVLSVHDSFIIDYTQVGELKRAMGVASKLIIGRELTVEANGLGLDEFEKDEESYAV